MLVLPCPQMLGRNAHAHLANIAQRRFLVPLDLPDGVFQPEVRVVPQRLSDAHHPAGRGLHQPDGFQLRRLGVPQLGQAVVYFPLHEVQFPLFLPDEGLLCFQLGLNAFYTAVLQILRNFIQRQAQRPQVADVGQPLKLPHAIIAVARVRVGVLGLQQARLLVVAQGAHAEVIHLGHFADLKEFSVSHARPPWPAAA